MFNSPTNRTMLLRAIIASFPPELTTHIINTGQMHRMEAICDHHIQSVWDKLDQHYRQSSGDPRMIYCPPASELNRVCLTQMVADLRQFRTSIEMHVHSASETARKTITILDDIDEDACSTANKITRKDARDPELEMDGTTPPELIAPNVNFTTIMFEKLEEAEQKAEQEAKNAEQNEAKKQAEETEEIEDAEQAEDSELFGERVRAEKQKRQKDYDSPYDSALSTTAKSNIKSVMSRRKFESHISWATDKDLNSQINAVPILNAGVIEPANKPPSIDDRIQMLERQVQMLWSHVELLDAPQ